MRLRSCWSIYLSIYLSVCLRAWLPIYLSVCLPVWLSIYLSVCLAIYQSIYLPTYFIRSLSLSLSLPQCVTDRFTIHVYIEIDMNI
jgi:hypothetical protein